MGLLEKNCSLVKVLDFVKYVRNVGIFNWEPQKVWCFFFARVLQFSFFIEQLFTHLTMHCLKFLLHIDNHIDLVDTVTFVDRISGQNQKTLVKKANALSVPSQRFQYFRHILENAKLNLKTSLSSSPITA